MTLKDLRRELADEVSQLLSADFSISITSTKYVPSSDDASITFPNFDNQSQGAKVIDTCVLYIDIRRSTALNLKHKPQTVAKLYSAFIRAMTRVARHYSGHVRGIIGDRLMVIFDSANCFANAVHCSIAMNTVSKHIINAHFTHNEVACGIGIDAGKMLATKTGIRKHGSEQANYRNIVWLGRPANVASKLTDVANKSAEYVSSDVVHVALPSYPNALGGLLNQSSAGLTGLGELYNALGGRSASGSSDWRWTKQTPKAFLESLDVRYAGSSGASTIVHKDPGFQSFFLTTEQRQLRSQTPPILMSKAVWDGFRSAVPASQIITKGLIKKIAVRVPDYSGDTYGSDAIYPDLKD